MITTITLNPALDKTVKVPGLNYGEVNRVGAFREDIGLIYLSIGFVRI